jgi:AAA domain
MSEVDLLKNAIDALSSTSKTITATDITQVDRMKVALCGDPKTGKSSVIARTARKPLLHYDFDDRKESIAGLEQVIIKTMFDKTDDQPVAWGLFESDLGTLEYLKSKNELPFKSIAVDSITFLRKYAEHQLLKNATGITRASLKVGSTNYLVPKDWDAVTGVQHMLETALCRLFALDVDIYVTFHTRPEKDQQKSTKLDPVYKDKLTVDPPNLKMLLPKFNDTWLAYIKDGIYMLQLKPDFEFDASTVLKNTGTDEIADIQKLLEKHNGK